MPDRAEDPIALRDRLLAEAGALVDSGKFEEARARLQNLVVATIDEYAITETDRLFERGLMHGRRRVASCDPARLAKDGEQVVIYGNYPHAFQNVLINDTAKRHVSWFWKIRHDTVESDAAWNAIGPIIVINQDARPDRWDSILNELARARAPFDRIHRLSATELAADELPDATPQFRATVGCLRSHLRALEEAQRSQASHALILEDDFTFTTDLQAHLQDLGSFVRRRYDYWVCLLGTSKYGLILEVDDLVSRSLQPCTNAEAYLVSADGLPILLDVFRNALRNLLATGKADQFAADRAWSCLQPSGKFLVFRRKMGFQASSFSSIEGQIARYFD